MHALTLWDKQQNPRDLSRQNVEVWAEIPGTNGKYFASNLGRVYSLRTDSVLDGSVNNSNRLTVGIYYANGQKPSTQLVYRLELQAFDGPPKDDQPDVRHLDGDETNNLLHNLLYGSRSENMQDVVRHRKEGRQKSRAERGDAVWYRGDLLDSSLVQRAMELYNDKKLDIEGIALLLNCTHQAAQDMIKGKVDYGINISKRAQASGREGEHHHAAVCTDAQLIEALHFYVDNRWSGVQFAAHLNILQLTAHMILSGRTRMNVGRPAGFQYPWPDAHSLNRKYGEEHGCAKITEAEIYAVFTQIEDGALKNMKEVQQALGVTRGVAYSIVSGRSWAHLVRSEKFKEAIAKMQRVILSATDQKAVIEALLRGDAREKIKDTYGLSDSKLQAYITKANKKKKELADSTSS